MILENRTDPKAIYEALRSGKAQEALADCHREAGAVIISGSYARGLADPLSDVDVLVLTDEVPGPWGSQESVESVEETLRKALGTNEVYANPIHIEDLSFLRRSLAHARPLLVRDQGKFDGLMASAFPDGGVPTVMEVERETWLARTERVLDRRIGPWHRPRICLNLGHQAIRHLGLPLPQTVEDIPQVLLDAGIVRRREAEWVYAAFMSYEEPLDEWISEEHHRDLDYGRDLGKDFAWHVQVALERHWFILTK